MKRFLWLVGVVLLFALAIPAVANSIVYDNGPINGEINAWGISGEFSVSNSFALGATTDVASMHFGVWVTPGEVPATVDFGISAAAFGNDLGSGTAVALANVFQGTNSAGADVYLSSFTFPSINLAAGTYYVTLTTGLTTNGAGLFWDENDGPSVAFANSHTGPIGSESFAIDATPEPGTLLMLATGFAGIVATIRRVRF